MRQLHSSIARAFSAPLLVVTLLAAGCSRSGGDGYVARVGNAVLTADDMKRVRAARGDSTIDPQLYVNEWVATELLYQEAERQGIAGSEDVQHKLEQAKRRLAVAALLEKELYSDTSGVTDETIRNFYQQHAQAFTLQEDVANVSYVVFAGREEANAFRTRVLNGTRWDDAVAKLKADSTGERGLLQTADHQYFTRSRLYPPELWKLALTLPREDVSFVLKTDEGFCVLTVHSVQRQGQVPDEGYVHNEVRDRLLVEHRRLRYEKLINDLRAASSVDVRPELAGAPTHE